MQDALNGWLCKHDGGIKITGRLQSQSNYLIVITIFYELIEEELPDK